MLGTQIVILSIILLIIPTVIGTVVAGIGRGKHNLPFVWVSGQILLWAGFLAISVPFILLEKTFTSASDLYGLYTVLFLVVAIVVYVIKCFREKQPLIRKLTVEKWEMNQWVLWLLFAILLLFQLIMSVCMSYEEGDDAFYVAISTATVNSDSMYQTLPYTGFGTELDARHGLAPFPIWIAYLAKLSGMPAVSVAQVALPIVLIMMAYAIYYLIAERLLVDCKKNIPLFLILVEVMILFGGYSAYSAENFLLVRATQGKAVIASIIIPFLLYLLLLLLDKIQKQEKIELIYWLLLAATTIAGCLCSTLGTMLTCMLLGVVGICTAVSYRKWIILFPLALCCVVPMVLALLYFLLR